MRSIVKYTHIYAVIVLTVTTSVACTAAVFFVNNNTGNDTRSGLSWSYAKASIQAALTLADNGDQVWVAKGIYSEDITSKSGVSLYGGFSGIERELTDRVAFPRSSPDPNETVWCGKSRVISSDQTTLTVFDGFTIVKGDEMISDRVLDAHSNMDIIAAQGAISASNGGYTESGGGIYCAGNSSPVISNCVISDNRANSGGGIYCEDNASPRIINNTIMRNTAVYGGGIYCEPHAAPTLANCIIASNSSGIYMPGCNPTRVNNCVYNPSGVDYYGLSAGPGDIVSDPLFSDNQGCHLSVRSPCVNAGCNGLFGISSVDVDGEPRFLGGVVDIGADECWQKALGISEAKVVADGIQTDIDSAVVMAAFSNFFYIESEDRACGIRVDALGHSAQVGDKTRVTGSIKTDNNYERYIQASSVTPVGQGQVRPLGMNLKHLGGGNLTLDYGSTSAQHGITGRYGTNNVGLLVRVWGKFLKTGDHRFTLSDNEGTNVLCEVPENMSIDDDWSNVIVTGVSSCIVVDNQVVSLIRVRCADDIIPL